MIYITIAPISCLRFGQARKTEHQKEAEIKSASFYFGVYYEIEYM